MVALGDDSFGRSIQPLRWLGRQVGHGLHVEPPFGADTAREVQPMGLLDFTCRLKNQPQDQAIFNRVVAKADIFQHV